MGTFAHGVYRAFTIYKVTKSIKLSVFLRFWVTSLKPKPNSRMQTRQPQEGQSQSHPNVVAPTVIFHQKLALKAPLNDEEAGLQHGHENLEREKHLALSASLQLHCFFYMHVIITKRVYFRFINGRKLLSSHLRTSSIPVIATST